MATSLRWNTSVWMDRVPPYVMINVTWRRLRVRATKTVTMAKKAGCAGSVKTYFPWRTYLQSRLPVALLQLG
jgi:hypothetical protein